MRAAAVPDEARQARNVADLLNGTDPSFAARAGVPVKAAPKQPGKATERARGRWRFRRPGHPEHFAAG